MKAKKNSAVAAKKKSAAKPVAKPVKKAAPAVQRKSVKTTKPAVKPVSKMAAKKPKAVTKPVKVVAGKTLVAKPSGSGFSIKAAAAKLKNALNKATTKPVVSKTAKPAPIPNKPKPKTLPPPVKVLEPIKKPQIAVAIKTDSKKPATKPLASKSHYVSPKGVLTEDQIRRMSDKDYMNDSQLEFFRHRLLQMRNEVLERELDVKERLHQREVFADPADRATAEEEHWLDLRLRERESLLLHKIDDAMRRIADKEYGYCEKTGDAIGIPRLLARPTATVCVDVKGQDERIESQFRDR